MDTILIVDEDVNAQIIAETLLRLRGLDVCRARTAAEALAFLEHESVALVVLDVSLPDVQRLVGLRRPQADLRVAPRLLAVTKRHDADGERIARRLGADAILYKPLAPAQFLKTVDRFVCGTTSAAA